MIPALLARIAYRDPIFNLSDQEGSMGALNGFLALGDRIRPALPALGDLMDSNDQTITLYSMFATLATGVDSVPYLLKGMTNRCAEVRSEAVTTLTWGSGFANERRKALPLLSHLLNDPDEMVRQTATNALKEINLPNATRTKIK